MQCHLELKKLDEVSKKSAYKLVVGTMGADVCPRAPRHVLLLSCDLKHYRENREI